MYACHTPLYFQMPIKALHTRFTPFSNYWHAKHFLFVGFVVGGVSKLHETVCNALYSTIGTSDEYGTLDGTLCDVSVSIRLASTNSANPPFLFKELFNSPPLLLHPALLPCPLRLGRSVVKGQVLLILSILPPIVVSERCNPSFQK